MSSNFPLLSSLLSLLLLCVATAQTVVIGSLSSLSHGVSGTLTAIDSRTLRLENFNYDGLGPRAVFWADIVPSPTSQGRTILLKDLCTFPSTLESYSDATVDLELPSDLSVFDVKYFSVWCVEFDQSFGGIALPQDGLSILPVVDTPTCASSDSGGSDAPADAPATKPTMSDIFPVRSAWNCEPLSDTFQVRWQIDGGVANFELVSSLPQNGYMGFGLSGSPVKTTMTNSDVVITYRKDGNFEAIDYFMPSRDPCDASTRAGVCPDTILNPQSAKNDAFRVSGDVTKDELVSIRYSRPLLASDSFDISMNVSGVSFITWAIGSLDSDFVPQFHTSEFPKGRNVSLEFGRSVSNNCSDAIVAAPEVKDVPGFERPVIYNETEITARIGPSGGGRGISALINRSSWGIGWYLSPTGSVGKDILVPVLGVERGKTYTFSVFGGDSKDSSSHPFYITSNADGGFQRQSPAQRAEETIYAGIDNIETDAQGGITAFRATGKGAMCQISGKNVDTSMISTYEEYFKTLNTSCTEDPDITKNGGTLKWKVKQNTPDEVYYGCVTHRYLGFKIRVFDEGNVDLDVLRRASGGGSLDDITPSPSPAASADCKVTFKNKVREDFKKCNKFSDGFELYWNIKGEEIKTLFRAPTSGGYVGFGWGYEKMVPANALIAFKGQDGKAEIFDYGLSSKSTRGVQVKNNQKFRSVEAAIDGEFVGGLFTRNLTGVPAININGTKVIWAMGEKPSSKEELVRHTSRDSRLINLATGGGGESIKVEKDTIFKVHGGLLGASWIVLSPYAIIVMKYFKKMNPITFQVHRAVNSLVVVLTIVGYIMGISKGPHVETAHLVIGSIVVGLVILQGMAGYLRPSVDAGTTRKMWYLFHASIGAAVAALGITNSFIGIDIIGGGTGWFVASGIVCGLAVLLYFTLWLFLSTSAPVEADRDIEGKGRTE